MHNTEFDESNIGYQYCMWLVQNTKYKLLGILGLAIKGIALCQRVHHRCSLASLNHEVQPLLEESGRPSIAGVSRNPPPQFRTDFVCAWSPANECFDCNGRKFIAPRGPQLACLERFEFQPRMLPTLSRASHPPALSGVLPLGVSLQMLVESTTTLNATDFRLQHPIYVYVGVADAIIQQREVSLKTGLHFLMSDYRRKRTVLGVTVQVVSSPSIMPFYGFCFETQATP